MSFLDDLAKGATSGVFSGIAEIIGKFKADPNISAQAAAKVAELEASLEQARLTAEIEFTKAQNRVNELEAQSTDKFASRWRPAIGWICGGGLCYTFIIRPFLTWGSLNWGWVAPPTLEIDSLMTLLFGMLGLGVQRSWDKMKGTTK